MKNSFLYGLAAAAMMFASCSNDETVEEAQNQNAILFKGFVNKSTRAIDLAEANLDGFKVWGIMKKGSSIGNPFVGKDVTKSGSSWTYSPPVYWEKGYSYSFVALASNGTYTLTPPSDYKTWGSLAFNNTDGTKDLLYAAKDCGTVPGGACPAAVGFTFNHILSRVRFVFDYNMPDGSAVTVSDIAITNAF